ncbi:MAG: sterol desaturase family protein [Chitinophagaceae bacterium]|nr:sterol desaturase family protein [Chitinophagaceae bacterium]
MNLNYLALAVPLFVSLMVIEFFVAKKRGKRYFNFTNSVTNINVGIAERLLDTLITGLFFFVYDYLQRHFGIFSIQPSVVLWVALFICTDFTWYWYHRLAHEINIFWAAHVVHHQSEDFNYTVSARITVFQAIIRTGFWAILPIIGFPAEMITSVLLVHGLYPFFIHTRLIGKLGILEYILVTPSHHRVHHASNPHYLDKNYGDVLIIWDKLFGTFAKEEEEVVYGLTKPLKTQSFLWQHFHFLLEIYYAAKKEKGFRNKMRVIFGRPDDIDPDLRDKLERKFYIRNNEKPADRELNRYVVWQVVFSLVILFLFILFEHHLSWQFQVLATLFILLTLVNCGAILEQRGWIFYLEYARAVIALLAALLLNPSLTIITLALLAIGLSLYYFNRLENRYLGIVYK